MDLIAAITAFNRVAGTGSFSAAARSLGSSTSAVSRYVSELENELGVRLLHRSTRKLSLTEAGRHYLQRSAALLEEIDELQNSLRAEDSAPSGTLRLSTTATFGQSCLMPLLPEFLDRYPQINLSLDMSNRLVDLVEDGFDLAIRMGELEDSSQVARLLMRTNYVLCASPDYVAKHGLPDCPAALSEHQCVLYQDLRTTAKLMFEGSSSPIPLQGRISLSSGEAARHAALTGLGVAQVADYLVADDFREGRLLEVLPGHRPPDEPVYAVYNSRRHLSARIKLFLDYLAEKLGDTCSTTA